MNPDWLCLLLGLGVGILAGWVSYRGKQINLRRAAEGERRGLEMNHNALQIEFAKMAERNRILDDQRQTIQTELAQERQFNISLHAELSRERASRSHLEQKLDHQKTELSQFQQRLSQEFKSLVHQVLEEKSQTLSDLNKSNLNLLLQPISEKLQDFKQKIEEQHYRETRELIVLHNKLANLESGRWRQSNGTPPTPSASNLTFPSSSSSSAEQAAILPHGQNENGAPSTDGPQSDDRPAAVVPYSVAEKTSEGDAFQGFSPKQEVEIDNFLKRTLGRVQRKKPGE